jgi:N-methylhydantoinase A
VRGDFGITCLAPAAEAGLPAIQGAIVELEARSRGWIADERLDPATIRFERALELRYLGQSSELAVPLPAGACDATMLAEAVTTFHALHERRFGYAMPQRPVEAVTLRLVATAARPQPPAEVHADTTPRPTASRLVWFRSTGFVETPVLDRAALAPGESLRGPAVLEQMDTTTIVPPGWIARADRQGNLILKHEETTR